MAREGGCPHLAWPRKPDGGKSAQILTQAPGDKARYQPCKYGERFHNYIDNRRNVDQKILSLAPSAVAVKECISTGLYRRPWRPRSRAHKRP